MARVAVTAVASTSAVAARECGRGERDQRIIRALGLWIPRGGRVEPEPARWARLDFGVEATVVRAAVAAGRGVGGQRREERRDREEGPLVWVVLDGLEVGAYECRVRGGSLQQ